MLMGSAVGDYLIMGCGLILMLLVVLSLCTKKAMGLGYFILGGCIVTCGFADLIWGQSIAVVQDNISYIQKNNMDTKFLNKSFLLLKQGWLADGEKTYDCKVYQDEQKIYYLLLRKEESKELPIEIYKQSSIEGKNMLTAIKGSVLQ